MGFQQNYICIGAGSLAENLIEKWILLGVDKPRFILDSDINKEGQKIEGIDIVHIRKIREFLNKNDKIVITSSFVDEIKTVLNELGLPNDIYDYKQFDLDLLQSAFLYKNKSLKGSQKGNRCFIIGNGPSLKHQNLSYLEKEQKIMVNQFYKSNELLSLKPQYWMLADPLYWERLENLLEPILKIVQDDLKETMLFLPQESLKNLVKYQKVINHHRLNYYYMNEYNDNSKLTEIDFTKIVPCFAQNVMSTSLMLALFLGFKEIYLIGCDHTWWGFNKKDVEQEEKIHLHYYKDSNKDVELLKKSFRKLGYEKLRDTIDRQIFEYETLNQFAKKQGVKIFNATKGGYLEVFQRKDYDSIFKHDNEGV